MISPANQIVMPSSSHRNSHQLLRRLYDDEMIFLYSFLSSFENKPKIKAFNHVMRFSKTQPTAAMRMFIE